MPPLDDTGDLQVSPDLKKSAQDLGSGQVAKPIDRSSALAQSLESRLPAAIEAEEAQAKEQKGLAQKTAGELSHTAEERSLLKAPVPMPPTMPPQRQPSDPWHAWGSPAMAFAMLASAFTRRPAINALNAAAGVMNAFHAGDDQAYKDQYQHWKDQTEYSHELYEYQRDAYKDAMEKLDKDDKTSLARLKVLASALSDEPIKRLADEGNVAGLTQTFRMRDDAHEKEQAEIPLVKLKGAAGLQLLEARKAQQADPNNPEKQQALRDAETYWQTVNMPTASAAAGHLDQQFVIADKDGNPVGQPFMAHRGPTGFVHAETNAPVEMDTGAGQHLIPAPKEAGKQAETFQTRMIGAANTADFVLHNLSRLPITASRGWLMGLETHTPTDMETAIRNSLARKMSDYDTKAMQQVAAGMGRVFGMLETQGGIQGMQTYGEAIQTAMTPQAGDPPLLTMRRLADARGIIDRAMETAEARTKDPKIIALLHKIKKDTEESVPYTVDDVADLEDAQRKAHGGKPADQQSVRDFAAKMFDKQKELKGGGGNAAPPDQAIKDLKANPSDEMKVHFDEVFGKGAAARALGP